MLHPKNILKLKSEKIKVEIKNMEAQFRSVLIKTRMCKDYITFTRPANN